jgi:phosphatidylethanolamine/phosphatidyl-N-methylethanolamine N-methyltransferase
MPHGHSFLRKFFRDPHGTGAIAPATRKLAASVGLAAREAYRRHLRAGSQGQRLRVVELGAGTGALTQCISPLNPVVVERDAAWAALLRDRFPELEVRQECATRTLRDVSGPIGVVTSIPMLNNPQSDELRALLMARYAEGLVKFCVLYTYGWTDPLRGAGFSDARRISFVPHSLPPAHVWVYH